MCISLIFTLECDPLLNTTSETVYVKAVRDIGTIAEYYCSYGYQSDNDPLAVKCEDSLFWNSSALNCSQKICPVEYVTKVCYNCGGVDVTSKVEYANTTEAECKNHINNNEKTSATYNRIDNMCSAFHSEAVESIAFENHMMHMRKSCNAGKIYLVYKHFNGI